jgi:hypothetical protein
MDTHERSADVPVQEKIVQTELIIQTRQKDTDPWCSQGKPFPGIFQAAARSYLRLVRTGYPGLKSRMIERSVIHRDRVVES